MFTLLFFPILSLAFHIKACSGSLKGSEETSERVLVVPVLSEDLAIVGFIQAVLVYILWTSQLEAS